MIPISKPLIEKEEKRAVLEVLTSGNLSQGKKVEEFEKSFASYIGTEHAIAINNGTTALHTALLASGIKKGDEIITTPFSFIATANCILYCGAKPKFADIDERTFNISPEKIKQKITTKTKALLIVHIYGLPCEMESILEICEEHDLLLIEDACQAHGAEYKGKKAGSFGDAACFSFYPSKNMTTGEGGMITTNDKKIAEKARLLREHGAKIRYLHEILGYNYRMTDIAAAMGIEQLKKLGMMNDRRRANAEIYNKELKNLKGLSLPFVPSYAKHVFHQYTVRTNKNSKLTRDQLAQALKSNGIATGIHYHLPIHLQPLYKKTLKIRAGAFPASEKAAKEVLSLPVHQSLKEEEVRYIAGKIKEMMG